MDSTFSVERQESQVMVNKAHHAQNRILFRANYDSSRVLANHFEPGMKAKSKSRASFHIQEFLSRVFASDGASRFFKTFLLRFLFDGGSKTSDDSSATLMARLIS
jgi:hypothetical protein